MPGTLEGKINVLGTSLPKPVVFGGAGIVVIGGIYYYRKNKTAAANAAAVTTAGSSATDPATGYPYGSPEDAAALANQANYNSPAGSGGGGSNSFGNTTPGSFLSNADWTQYVQAYIVDNEGGSAPIVSAALGAYINGTPLETDQVSIVQTAIAIGGYPPVNGPNGDPPNYTTSTSTPPATNGTCPAGYTYSATQTNASGEITATGGAGWCELNATTTPPPPPPPSGGNPLDQSGTVMSNTTHRSGQVKSSDGGYTWKYTGSAPNSAEPKNQTGVVSSTTTGKTAKVATYNAGIDWQYTG